MQDACPITLGAEFSAWAGRARPLAGVQVRGAPARRQSRRHGHRYRPDRTAQAIFRVTEKLRDVTHLGLSRAENLVDATQNADVFVEVSAGILKAHAVNLFKISSDLRLLASGPHTAGLGEVLPTGDASRLQRDAGQGQSGHLRSRRSVGAAGDEPGHGRDAGRAVRPVGTQRLPAADRPLLGNLALLERACTIFRERCIDGILANAARCSELLERSHAQVTALVPALGYELAADVAKEAQLSQESIRTVVLARGLLAPQVLDRLLSADAMTALGYTKNDFKD